MYVVHTDYIRKNVWIKSLITKDMLPEISLIEEVDDKIINEKENIL